MKYYNLARLLCNSVLKSFYEYHTLVLQAETQSLAARGEVGLKVVVVSMEFLMAKKFVPRELTI